MINVPDLAETSPRGNPLASVGVREHPPGIDRQTQVPHQGSEAQRLDAGLRTRKELGVAAGKGPGRLAVRP